MTALEERLRFVLRSEPVPLPDPFGPDEIVFGDPRGPAEFGEFHGWGFVDCSVHQVGWSGPGGCWCCADGVAPCR